MSDVIARDGDVLVVTYPEVKVPIAKYWTVGVGNLRYTRTMVAGESVRDEYAKITALLTEMAEHDANQKVQTWAVQAKGQSDAPPRPIPPSQQPPRAAGEKPASQRQVTR